MEWVRFLHVLLGAIWIGGAMYGEALMASAKGAGRDGFIDASLKVQKTSSTIYPVVVPLVAITAAILIWQSEFIGWGDMWISLSFAIWLVGLLVGILYFAKREKAAADRFAKEGSSDALAAELSATQRIQRMDLVLLTVLLALMIFQPA